jgi:MFS family permease
MNQPLFTKLYKRYVLSILTLVFTLNYLDRCLIALLLQPIKESLHLSDTQLGFLTGIAFGLFYATLGLPIARWADRGDRAAITSLAIGLWSATVMGCLLVGNFVQLALARIAASVGEAGCMPPTSSLLGDYFPAPAERTRAMAIYWLASPLSALISFMLGGWLNELYGWRITFFLMGLPGIVVAIVVKKTIIEPRRLPGQSLGAERQLPRMRQVVGALWQQRSSRHLSIAIIVLFTTTLGLSPWFAAFMVRSHGMGTGELGVWLGLIFGLGGVAGILLGGYVVERFFPSDEFGQMRLIAIVVAALFPCSGVFLLLPNKHDALFALIFWVVAFNFVLGPIFALLQRLVADEMRATVLAVVMLLANLIGMGTGSQAVGTLSDLMSPVIGSDSLRYAMLVMSIVALWSACHFWRAAKTVQHDLRIRTSQTPCLI